MCDPLGEQLAVGLRLESDFTLGMGFERFGQAWLEGMACGMICHCSLSHTLGVRPSFGYRQ